MEIKFSVTGEQRKALVRAIGEVTETTPIYKAGTYRIYVTGDITVDKDGILRCDERTDEDNINQLILELAERGFTAKYESVVGEKSATEDNNSLCIEMPLEGFTEATIGNLKKLVFGKLTLIKKAIGAESLPIIQTETTLRFPLFSADVAPDEIQAYAVFI